MTSCKLSLDNHLSTKITLHQDCMGTSLLMNTMASSYLTMHRGYI